MSWEDVSGRDLVLRWNRDTGPDGHLQVQAYYDYAHRSTQPHQGHFLVDTYDLDLQDSLPLGSRNQLVWGGGARLAHYRIDGVPNFFFDPAGRNLFLANAFVQDTLDLSHAVSLTGGFKAEHDPYVGTSLLPDVRISIKPVELDDALGLRLACRALGNAVRRGRA